MELEKVVLTIEQTHNLANYQSLKCAISLTASLVDSASIAVVMSSLKTIIYEEMHQVILTGVHRHENRLKLIAFMKARGDFDLPIENENPF